MAITVEQANDALKRVIDPNTGKDLVSTRSARNVRVDGSDVSVDVELGYPAASQIAGIRRAVIDKDCNLPPGTRIGVDPDEDRRRFLVTERGVTLVTPDMLGQEIHHLR